MNQAPPSDEMATRGARVAPPDAVRARRVLLEASPDAIVGVGSDGCISEFNRAAERVFGYNREAVLGRDMLEYRRRKEDRDVVL